MFLIFFKEKIYTYIVSIITVVLLFYIANNININKKETSNLTKKIIKKE